MTKSMKKIVVLSLILLSLNILFAQSDKNKAPRQFPAVRTPTIGNKNKVPPAIPLNGQEPPSNLDIYDSSIYYFLDYPVYTKTIKKTKENSYYSKRYLNQQTYQGGSRSIYWGYYDGFTAGVQLGKGAKNDFYELGFQSNRRFRVLRTALHFPTMLGVNVTFEKKLQTFGVQFEAREGLLRKEKYFNMYDLLYIGLVAKVYNNTKSTWSSQTIMPIVSFSPPGRYFNNLLFTYGYNYKVSGKEVVQMNYGHVFSIHYILPDF